jgi:hypothetical protein
MHGNRNVKRGRLAGLAMAMAAATMGLTPFAGPARAADPPAPAGAALRPDVLARLHDLVARSGHDTELPGSIAGALGLGASPQPWPDRQFAVQSRDTGALHAVALGQGAAGELILSVKGPAAILIFLTDRRGALVAAASYFPETKATMTPPMAAARADFAAECAFWALHIDGLTASE